MEKMTLVLNALGSRLSGAAGSDRFRLVLPEAEAELQLFSPDIVAVDIVLARRRLGRMRGGRGSTQQLDGSKRPRR